MSIEAVAIALHHSRSRGTAKIVLLGIANHDGDGGSFPKLATLAKYANVHPRRAAAAIKTLGELGEIIIHTAEDGKRLGGTFRTPDHVRPNLYEFVLTCPEGCDRTKNHRIDGEKIGRNYRGQYDPEHEKDPERVERARAARDRSRAAVENARLPERVPSDENSTSDGNVTTPSDGNVTTPSDGNVTTKHHQTEPPVEPGFVSTSPARNPAVEKQPPPRASRRRDDASPFGITPEQAQRNTKGAQLARKALRGELLAGPVSSHMASQAAIDDKGNNR